MTDKEQIKCNYKFQDKERFDGRPYCTCFDRLCEDLFFICDHNCQVYEDLKQLARKTQECEELEELLKLRTNDRIGKLERAIIRKKAKIDRYRKTLEEIEKEVHNEMCDTLGHLCAYCDGKHSCITLKILDIINQAKGKNNG